MLFDAAKVSCLSNSHIAHRLFHGIVEGVQR